MARKGQYLLFGRRQMNRITLTSRLVKAGEPFEPSRLLWLPEMMQAASEMLKASEAMEVDRLEAEERAWLTFGQARNGATRPLIVYSAHGSIRTGRRCDVVITSYGWIVFNIHHLRRS